MHEGLYGDLHEKLYGDLYGDLFFREEKCCEFVKNSEMIWGL